MNGNRKGSDADFRWAAVAAIVALLCVTSNGSAQAADRSNADTPIEALESAQHDLEGAVALARRGELSQHGLRLARRAIETRLELAIAGMAVDLRPGEFAALGDARARFHQAIIRSQEWETFGPNDRPEWGWFPSREIRSSERRVAVDAPPRE